MGSDFKRNLYTVLAIHHK